MLGAGVLGLLALSGCGPVRWGGPAEYTPPPPGIDDLYRADLLTLLDRAIAGTATVVGGDSGTGDAADGGSSPALATALGTLQEALPVQRSALLTGAETEREAQAEQDPDPAVTPSPAPTEVPADLSALITLLVELRELGTDAARQVSGSLARPVAAITAHTAWILRRLESASGQGEAVPAVRTAEEIEPTREVPTTDPPSIGAPSDFGTTIETAQDEEWYAAYVHEVLAARTDDEGEQASHLAMTETHRARAAVLREIAEAEGAPVVTREAVYPLPGGVLDERTAAAMPTELSRALLLAHLALTGAAPFAVRSTAIAAALAEAEVLAGLAESLSPLPSLEPETD